MSWWKEQVMKTKPCVSTSHTLFSQAAPEPELLAETTHSSQTRKAVPATHVLCWNISCKQLKGGKTYLVYRFRGSQSIIEEKERWDSSVQGAWACHGGPESKVTDQGPHVTSKESFFLPARSHLLKPWHLAPNNMTEETGTRFQSICLWEAFQIQISIRIIQ